MVEAFGGLPALEDADTGDLRTDLVTMLRLYLQHFNATPLATVLPSLAGARAHNPELEVFDSLLRDRRQPLRAAFKRAVARGEVSSELDLSLAGDLVVGPIAVRLYFTGARIHPRIVGPMVDIALADELRTELFISGFDDAPRTTHLGAAFSTRQDAATHSGWGRLSSAGSAVLH